MKEIIKKVFCKIGIHSFECINFFANSEDNKYIGRVSLCKYCLKTIDSHFTKKSK